MSSFGLAEATKLSDEIGRKTELLKKLDTSYTKALGCIESRNYDELHNELDIENNLLAEIGGPILKESSNRCDYGSAGDELRPILSKISSDIEIYERLLKNCGVLYEKLMYRVKEAKTESELHILGAFIDFKSN